MPAVNSSPVFLPDKATAMFHRLNTTAAVEYVLGDRTYSGNETYEWHSFYTNAK